MSPIRLIVADDETTIREALVDLLATDPEIEVTGVAANADEAIQLVDSLKPDIVLVDVKMPGGGARAAREMRSRSPHTKVIALTAYDDLPTVIEMLRAGAVGYLIKGAAPGDILKMISFAMAGQAIVPRTVMTEVIAELVSSLDRAEQMFDQFRRLDEIKAEMIQILSHELRTPVAILQGSALSLSDSKRELSPEDQAVLGESIRNSSQRISRLVNNVVAAATLDREEVEIATRPRKVGDLIDGAISEFPAERHRIRIQASDETLSEKVWAADDLAIRPLVLVVENALMLSAEDQPVEIAVRVGETEIELRILDRGPGVPEAMQERIFDAFTQVDSSLTRNHPGLGLGLYLAHRIVQAHRGRIAIEGREGGGSVIVIALPRFRQ